MNTIDSLIRRGYRLYRMEIKLTEKMKNHLRCRTKLLVEYHENLKIIAVRDAKSDSTI